MSDHYDFNISLLDEKNFQDQIELMLKRESTGDHNWELLVGQT